VKILNLDQLAAPKRKLVINGQGYEIVEMSVGAFIDAMAKAHEIEKRVADGETIGADESLKQMVEAVQLALPSCPKDVVRGLTFDQLALTIKFVNGGDPEQLLAEFAAPVTPSGEPVKEEGAKKS
jgi:hypothetical protein